MVRIDISKLEKNRSIFFKIGLAMSIGLALVLLNWTSIQVDEVSGIYKTETIEEEVIPVVHFPDDRKKVLPPPVVEVTTTEIETDPIIEVLEEEEEITNDPKTILDISAEGPAVSFVKPPEPTKIVQPVIKKVIDIVDKGPLDVSEIMPRFAGCEDLGLTDDELRQCAEKKLLTYMGSQLNYPPIARENGIEGTVVICFIVEKDGSISNLKTLKDIGGGCGQESLRVIKDMPKWIPGKQRGKKVRVRFRLPVRFKLK